MTSNTNQPEPSFDEQKPSPFIDPKDLPKMKLADGTEVKLKASPWRKSRLGRNYNGRHRD